MFHSGTGILTTAVMLLHSLLGCCWHHTLGCTAHSHADGLPHASSTGGDQVAAAVGHHCCSHGASATAESECAGEPDEGTPDSPGRRGCDLGECRFTVSVPVKVPLPLDGGAWYAADGLLAALPGDSRPSLVSDRDTGPPGSGISASVRSWAQVWLI